MPKISAPTVAVHRERQRAALVAAAEAELIEHGVASVTPAAVGKRTGLARSSVYEYFGSASDLIAEVAVSAFEQWGCEMAASLASSAPGIDRLVAYVRHTLRMVAEGKHDIAEALQGVTFSDEQNLRFMQLHRELMNPVSDAVRELGLSQPELRVELIQGVVDAATRQVARGADPTLVSDYAIALLTGADWLSERNESL
ncbi:TetR/AcrR family transcriptional regulator [Parafrigoribacterium soli]|uniref:TetR/AcrR family transcriptional regulator n=1 Tax=Parafrigoribacterium soli TaxID=3144663 RepID=UPI0032EAD7E6